MALFCALLINICVVAVFARGFYGTEGVEIGLENAGAYLGETFGASMRIIWAIGLLAAGAASFGLSSSFFVAKLVSRALGYRVSPGQFWSIKYCTSCKACLR